MLYFAVYLVDFFVIANRKGVGFFGIFTEVRAGELYHFCSETCRQSFLEAS